MVDGGVREGALILSAQVSGHLPITSPFFVGHKESLIFWVKFCLSTFSGEQLRQYGEVMVLQCKFQHSAYTIASHIPFGPTLRTELPRKLHLSLC